MLKTCSAPGCNRTDRICFGYCSKHYQRFKNTGTTDLIKKEYRPKHFCSMPGCNLPTKSRGYCRTHVMEYYKKEAGPTDRKCSLCALVVYSKGLCRNHYGHMQRNGVPKKKREIVLGHKCSVANCDNGAKHKSDSGRHYCDFHYHRKNHLSKLKMSSPKSVKGENHHSWKGGVTRYKNSGDFKKAKKELAKRSGGICEVCKVVKAKDAHHIDHGVSNHSLDNLLHVCKKCHNEFHLGSKRKPKSTSKFTRTYGNNLFDLSKKFNVKMSQVYRWHLKGILKDKLTQPA